MSHPDYRPVWVLDCARCECKFRWPSVEAIYCPECRKVMHLLAVTRSQARTRLRILAEMRRHTKAQKREMEKLAHLVENACGRCGIVVPSSRRLCDTCVVVRRRANDAAYRRRKTHDGIYAHPVDGYDGEIFAPSVTWRRT